MVFYVFCGILCVSFLRAILSCLQHSFFEHLFNLYFTDSSNELQSDVEPNYENVSKSCKNQNKTIWWYYTLDINIFIHTHFLQQQQQQQQQQQHQQQQKQQHYHVTKLYDV